MVASQPAGVSVNSRAVSAVCLLVSKASVSVSSRAVLVVWLLVNQPGRAVSFM